MTEAQYDNLKVGDIVRHVDLPDKTWIIVCASSLGGWELVCQHSMLQHTRMETPSNWELHSTIIERRRWY